MPPPVNYLLPQHTVNCYTSWKIQASQCALKVIARKVGLRHLLLPPENLEAPEKCL